MGMRTDPRGKSRPLTTVSVPLLAVYTAVAFIAFIFLQTGLCFQDAVHITAILGESVVFNCHVEFPDGHPVPYVLQWEKKVGETVGFQPVCSLTVVANGESLKGLSPEPTLLRTFQSSDDTKHSYRLTL